VAGAAAGAAPPEDAAEGAAPPKIAAAEDAAASTVAASEDAAASTVAAIDATPEVVAAAMHRPIDAQVVVAAEDAATPAPDHGVKKAAPKKRIQSIFRVKKCTGGGFIFVLRSVLGIQVTKQTAK
jgi:hypothetical protein